MPAKNPIVDAERGSDENEIITKQQKVLKMNGLFWKMKPLLEEWSKTRRGFNSGKN